MKEEEKEQYLFLQYTQYFYIDEDYKIKLTKIGEENPEVKESYDEYLKNYVH